MDLVKLKKRQTELLHSLDDNEIDEPDELELIAIGSLISSHNALVNAKQTYRYIKIARARRVRKTESDASTMSRIRRRAADLFLIEDNDMPSFRALASKAGLSHFTMWLVVAALVSSFAGAVLTSCLLVYFAFAGTVQLVFIVSLLCFSMNGIALLILIYVARKMSSSDYQEAEKRNGASRNRTV